MNRGIITMTKTSRRAWTEEETTLAYALYCSMPFGQIHSSNRKIKELAALIGRTPGAVSMKMCNLARFDPELQKRNVNGLKNGSKLDRIVFQKYESNLEELAYQVYLIKQNLYHEQFNIGISYDQELEELPEGKENLREVKTRIGQAAFRSAVLNSYQNKCCITGINNAELLVASHIKPWQASNPITEKTNPRNGLCLNSFHDKAFDCGLITIDKTFHVIISQNLAKTDMDESTREWLKTYDHKQINIPEKFTPSLEFIEYHNDVIFQG